MTYTQKEIEHLIERFENRRLPKPEWTHEAHLVVAVWYLKRHNPEAALDKVRENITRHNESVGTPNTDSEGYHETITRFWLLTVENFLQQHPGLDDENVCRLLFNDPVSLSSYPLKYYTPEVLFSVKARREWVPAPVSMQ